MQAFSCSLSDSGNEELENETPEETDTRLKIAERRRKVRSIVIRIVIVLALIAYTFIGAAIFQALEYSDDTTEVRVDLSTAKSELMESIWLANIENNVLNKDRWTEVVEQLLIVYDEAIAEAANLGINVTDSSQHNITVTQGGPNDWDFWDSLFYVATVYTTIGYGHLTPFTSAGKIATMIYAVIGIPLCLIVLAEMGLFLGEVIKYCMRLCKRAYYRCRRNELLTADEIDHLEGAPLLCCLVVLCCIYLFSGAALYRLWEDWSYLDSLYFLFVSFSTIGFGDITPKHPRYFLLTFVYIFLGLALMATGLTLIQQILKSTVNKATAKLGLKGSKLTLNEDVRESVSLVEMGDSRSNSAHH